MLSPWKSSEVTLHFDDILCATFIAVIGSDFRAMALTEFERKRIDRLAASFIEKRRPPKHIRDQLDFGYRISGQSFELFEIRPFWNDPSEKLEEPVAKATYVRKSNTWKIYWQRQDLRWHRYDPNPEVDSLEDFLAIVDADEYACFWG